LLRAGKDIAFNTRQCFNLTVRISLKVPETAGEAANRKGRKKKKGKKSPRLSSRPVRGRGAGKLER
jgi:hypothetical protein